MEPCWRTSDAANNGLAVVADLFVRFIHRALALCAPDWIVFRYLIADLLDTHTAKSAIACVSDSMSDVEAVVCPTAAVVRPALPKANKPAGDNAVGALL